MSVLREKWSYDDATGEVTIHKRHDVTDVIDRNKRSYADSSDYRPFAGGDMHKVAEIPLAVLDAWMAEDGVNYLAGEGREKFIARLNSSEYRYLRTKKGRI